jgi:hypothetical protein
MRTGLAAYGKRVVLVTITAPGDDVLPWDEAHCRHPRGGEHSGKRGCRVEQSTAREFNATASWRLAALRRAATVYAERATGTRPRFLDRAWEAQRRGVAHWHGVYGADTPAELEAVALLVERLKASAHEYGWGFVDAKGRKRNDPRARGKRVVVAGVELRLIAPEDAARYLASYLAGRSAHKASMRTAVMSPEMRSLIDGVTIRRQSLPLWWLSPTLTKLTLVTMRTLRRARHLWAELKGVADVGPSWRDARDAITAALVLRTVFGRKANAPPLDVAGALRLAGDVDRAGAERVTIFDGFAEWELERRHTAGFRAELARLARMLAEPAMPHDALAVAA